MDGPVEVTVFPRLDCCVPDYTGKNRLLAEVLAELKQRLGDRVRIEVVPTGTRAERLVYYDRMLQALLLANWPLPFATGSDQLAIYREAIGGLGAGLAPSPAVMAGLRQASVYFFGATPVIALHGRAIFVTTVPSIAELSQAVENVLGGRATT